MGDMGVRDELKEGTGVDWCGTWVDMSRQLMAQVFLDMTNVGTWVQVE